MLLAEYQNENNNIEYLKTINKLYNNENNNLENSFNLLYQEKIKKKDKYWIFTNNSLAGRRGIYSIGYVF